MLDVQADGALIRKELDSHIRVRCQVWGFASICQHDSYGICIGPILVESVSTFQDIFEKHGLLDRVAHWSDDELLEAKTLRSCPVCFWIDSDRSPGKKT